MKKYLNEISLGSEAIQGFASCSNGRRMLRPNERSPPAPSWAELITPPPAPVITIHPAPVMRLPKA